MMTGTVIRNQAEIHLCVLGSMITTLSVIALNILRELLECPE